MSKNEDLGAAIKGAATADVAFEAAVQAAGFKSRWDWNTSAPGLEDLHAAYRAKIEADSEMHAAFVLSRVKEVS